MARRTSSSFRGLSKTGLTAVLAVVAIALVSCGGDGYYFQRQHLDRYIEENARTNDLNSGISVYFDMSNGMNSAYKTDDSKKILQGIINKLADGNNVEFFGLADKKIEPMDLDITQLYNHMLNPASYTRQMAPIGKALEQIVAKKQPAVLMSDYEEYKGTVIERAAYAKKYFIEWLKAGYNITFYSWGFTEGGKDKKMFLTVFDDNTFRLSSMVENAVKLASWLTEDDKFVLGGRDFGYPMIADYVSERQGGNYHNADNKDIVSAVFENDNAESYKKYDQNAEYYPIGETWANVISNSKAMSEDGIKPENRFEHLLGNLYVDFGAQNGFDIDGIEARVSDVQQAVRAMVDTTAVASEPTEIKMAFTADLEDDDAHEGWDEITVDFHERFDGTFAAGINPADLIRIEIIIDEAKPEINEARDFFSWQDNPSLANSVLETLTDPGCSPKGRVLYTYYLKTL